MDPATHKQLVSDAATIVVSLLDYRGPLGKKGRAIASHLYLLVCNGDIHRFNMAKGLLESEGWIVSTSELVALTDAGTTKAREIQAMLDEAPA